MSKKRVVIEIEFSVEREHFAFLGHDEWIDLDHRAIAADERAVQSVEQLGRAFGLRMPEREPLRELAGLKWLQPGNRIDGFANNFFRPLSRHCLDLYAPFGACYNQRRRRCSI